MAAARSGTSYVRPIGISSARFAPKADVSDRMRRYGCPSSVKRSICGRRPTVEIVMRSPRMRSPHGSRRTAAARITCS
jgi:hypothetical protein